MTAVGKRPVVIRPTSEKRVFAIHDTEDPDTRMPLIALRDGDQWELVGEEPIWSDTFAGVVIVLMEQVEQAAAEPGAAEPGASVS